MIRFSGGVECTVKSEKSPLRRGLLFWNRGLSLLFFRVAFLLHFFRQKFSTDMIITFNELRRIKDRLPSGSSQRIADELGIDVDTVRNYFGGKHESKECVGVHFEPGPDGGVVTLDDTTILDVAMRILSEQ